MKIFLKQFGTILVSRPAGKESFLALQPLICDLQKDENLEIDFSGVKVFTPSWADEFITPLAEKYKKRLIVLPSENLSVKATLETLRKSRLRQKN